MGTEKVQFRVRVKGIGLLLYGVLFYEGIIFAWIQLRDFNIELIFPVFW